jgi:hypothetical protein
MPYAPSTNLRLAVSFNFAQGAPARRVQVCVRRLVQRSGRVLDALDGEQFITITITINIPIAI